MNTARANTPRISPDASTHRDALDWARAGGAWRRIHLQGDSPAEIRVGRTVLVNSVLGALKRFDCGLCDDRAVAGALHDAVQRFNQRVA
jgi:hypothetical protein